MKLEMRSPAQYQQIRIHSNWTFHIYEPHNWKICVDLKAINFSFGLQSGYTKRPCIYKVFPGLTIEKLKNGIFNGTDIRKLIKDQNLVTSMNEHES